MKILVAPRGGGEVIECDSMRAAHEAALKLYSQGFTELSTTRVDLVCDFCSSSEITKLYNAIPDKPMYVIETHDGHVFAEGDGDGLWAGCPACSADLDAWVDAFIAGDLDAAERLRTALEDRACERFPADGMPDELVRFSIRMTQGFFMTNWNKKKGVPLISDSELMGGN